MSQVTVGARAASRPIAGHERVVIGFGLVSMFASVVAFTLLVVALAPLIWGWQPVVVTSGSMTPAIEVGDVVVNRPTDGRGLGPGTVITYTQGATLVTHRIETALDDGTYLTRGDAGRTTDSTPVSPDEVVGIGTILVPYIGYPYAAWAQGDRTMSVLLVAALVLATMASRLAYPDQPRS